MEQRTANGPGLVLIRDGKKILRDVLVEYSGKAKAKHTRGFTGEGGKNARRLTPEHGASSVYLQPRYLPFFWMLVLLILGMLEEVGELGS